MTGGSGNQIGSFLGSGLENGAVAPSSGIAAQTANYAAQGIPSLGGNAALAQGGGGLLSNLTLANAVKAAPDAAGMINALYPTHPQQQPIPMAPIQQPRPLQQPTTRRPMQPLQPYVPLYR
jgi:hypothetical protein